MKSSVLAKTECNAELSLADLRSVSGGSLLSIPGCTICTFLPGLGLSLPFILRDLFLLITEFLVLP